MPPRWFSACCKRPFASFSPSSSWPNHPPGPDSPESPSPTPSTLQARWNGLLLFQDAFDWLPGVEVGAALSPAAYLGWRRSGIVVLALLQLLALYGCLNPAARRSPAAAWRWLIGPLLGSIALLPYPPINTDVFYYAASGRIAAIGENPYLTAPLEIPDEPFAAFNDWGRITTPYGPVWTTTLPGGLCGHR